MGRRRSYLLNRTQTGCKAISSGPSRRRCELLLLSLGRAPEEDNAPELGNRGRDMARCRVEEDLIDQLFNSSEKRLARALLLLARYGEQDRPQKQIPRVSQDLLAEMIGTTRPRVSVFMNKFRKLGFIEYGARLRGLQINKSLLSVVLHD